MSILVLTLTLTLPNLAVTASRRLTQGGIDALLAAGSQLELIHVYDQSAPAFLEYAEFRSAELRRARTQHLRRPRWSPRWRPLPITASATLVDRPLWARRRTTT